MLALYDNPTKQFILPALPYGFEALEPIIDAKTMEIHHAKHHQGYVDKLNAALVGHSEMAEKPLEELLGNLAAIPEDIRTAVQNNGGGHYNHTIFWELMSSNAANPASSAGKEPSGVLAEAITSAFGAFAQFKEQFSNAAATRFGSGWVWLVKKKGTPASPADRLALYSTPNQDNPLMQGDVPILGLDVWEHAYYLTYQNRRPEYVEQWWNVVNWSAVGERYESIKE